MCEIVSLPRTLYEGYAFPFDYESELYYDVRIRDISGGFGVDFVRMPFPRPFVKQMEEHLFDQPSDAPEAHGIFEDDTLVALTEISPEFWNNRLRVIHLWVHRDHRRKGYGRMLMDKAKQIALSQGRRAVVLETQSSNSKAIEFYLSQGFMLGGFDATAYTNEDIEKKEVRLEMIYRPPRG